MPMQGDNCDQRQGLSIRVRKCIQQLGIDIPCLHKHGVQTAERDNAHDSNGDEGQQHQDALQEIRPAHCEKTAHEGVGHHGSATRGNRPQIGKTKHLFEKAPAGDQPGARVESKENKDKEGRDQSERTGAVVKTPFEIVWQGQGITVVFCRPAQSGSRQFPVEIGSRQQAHQ